MEGKEKWVIKKSMNHHHHHHHHRFTSTLSTVHTKARVRRYQPMLDLIMAPLIVALMKAECPFDSIVFFELYIVCYCKAPLRWLRLWCGAIEIVLILLLYHQTYIQ